MTCILCHTDLTAAQVVNTVARNGYPQTSVVCPRCGLCQVTPMPSAEEVTAYYASGEYRREFPPLPVGSVRPGDTGYEAALDDRASQAADWLVLHGMRRGDTVTEIGCGDGRLAAALTRRGLLVDVVEADPAMLEKARSRGCSVWLEEKPWRVDWLLSCQVLEHQTDPVATLRGWRRLVDYETGRLHVEVPTLERMYGGASHFFQRPHLVNFTTRTLRLALLVAGFDNVRTGLNGSVLWATAEHGQPMTIDAALAEVGPPDDVAALIAAHEESRKLEPRAGLYDHLPPEMREALDHFDAAPYGPLLTWLASEDMAATPAIKEMAVRFAHEMMRQRVEWHTYVERLNAKAEGLGAQWSSDAFWWGYSCGQSRRALTDAMAASAILNAQMLRVGE